MSTQAAGWERALNLETENLEEKSWLGFLGGEGYDSLAV